jgi:ferredoxin
MKVRVDLDRCVGHGRCYDLAPEIFTDDADGHCQLLRADVPPELEEKARVAAENCPEEAIGVDAEAPAPRR